METKLNKMGKFGKMYFIYSKDGKEYIHTCIGVKELSKFLSRDIQSVWGSISRLRKGTLKHIKNYNGDYFTIISEDDMRIGEDND